MKTVAVIVSVALLMSAGLVRGQQKTDPSLDRLALEFAAAFNAKNAMKISAFYTDDAVLMPPAQSMVRGRGNIEAYYARGFEQDVSDFRLMPMESAVAGGHAFEAGTSRLTHRRGLSSRAIGAVTESGKYLVVYKRVGSEWKIAYDIFNTD